MMKHTNRTRNIIEALALLELQIMSEYPNTEEEPVADSICLSDGEEEYVHYGNDSFDPEHEMSGENAYKPSGMWASPVDSDWNWKDWCLSEEYETERLKKSFRFRLRKGTKVLRVTKPDDVLPYTEELPGTHGLSGYFSPMWNLRLNHEKLRRECDAMEVLISHDPVAFRATTMFYPWDVDSLVVWNPDCVVPEEKTGV